ncbi:MAG TPA: CHAT domain-containing protein, partial [Nostocaceae cyanobacterium]|nr:CHAT domain-containing protein [Nostocaceae cyanobacterium]
GNAQNGSGAITILQPQPPDAPFITFDDPVTITSPQGSITVNGEIKGESSVTLDAPIIENYLNASITTNNQDIIFKQPVTLGDSTKIKLDTGAVPIGSTTAAKIRFEQTLNGAGDLILSAGGEVQFLGDVGSVDALNSLTVERATKIYIAGDITTKKGDISFSSPVEIAIAPNTNLSTPANPVIPNSQATLNAGTNKISFGQSLEVNNNSLILVADEIDFLGTAGSVNGDGTGKLTIQPFTDSQKVVVNGAEGTPALDISTQDFASLGSGLESLIIGSENGSGNVTINPTTVKNNLEVRSPNGSITTNGLTVDGNVTLDATTTTLNGSITTQGRIDIPKAIFLGSGAVTLNTKDADLNLGSTVDGSGSLILNAGTRGNISVGGDVGSTTRLSGLKIEQANSASFVSNVTTKGDIIFNIPYTLTGQGSKTFDAENGTVAFRDTLTLGNNNLKLVGNEIDFGGKVSGTGNLQLEPGTATAGFILSSSNNTTPDTVDLTPTELNYIQNGFKSITIGGDNTGGKIVIGDGTIFRDPVTIKAPQGTIETRGRFSGTDDASITLAVKNIASQNVNTNNIDLIIDGNTNLTTDTTFSTGTATLTIKGTLDTGNHTLTLAADEINLPTTPNSISSNGGKIFLQPVTTSRNIIVAGSGDNNSLSFTAEELTSLKNGFSSITIGNEKSGAITINPYSFQDTLNIQSGSSITATGAINFTDNDAGISFKAPDIKIRDITTNNSNIILDGKASLTNNTTLNAGNASIEIKGSLVASSNNLNLIADEINLPPTANSIRGTGNLVIQPFTSSLNIAIGGNADTGNTTLDLTTTDLTTFADGFSSLTIGSNNGSGLVDIKNISVNDPIIIKSPTGNIVVNGQITTQGNSSINLDSLQTTFNSGITTNNQPINLAQSVFFAPGANIVFDSGNADIILNTISGDADLILKAGTGKVKLTGNLGEITPLKSFTSNASETNISANLNTTGNITFNNPLTVSNNVTLNSASGDITFNNKVTAGNNQLNIKANNINAFSEITGQENSLINLVANQNITTSNIATVGGEIKLTSENGTITTGNLNSGGNSQNITVQAAGNVITGNVSTSTNIGNAAIVTLSSKNGAVETGNVNTSSTNGDGGAVNILARDRIFAKVIDSSSLTGNGGAVTLDPDNDIVVTYINSQGGSSGKGGDVNITTRRYFQATGTFSDRNNINASISTFGGTGSGTITINHGNNTFVVGDATTSGTAGAIVSAINDIIQPVKSIPGNYTQGNIQINSPAITPELATLLPPLDTPNQDSTQQAQEQSQVSEDTVATIPVTSTNNNVSAATEQQAINQVEETTTQEFSSFLGLSARGKTTTEGIQTTLRQIQTVTNIKSALIYVNFANQNCTRSSGSIHVVQDSDVLCLGIVTADALPTYQIVPGTTRKQVMAIVGKLRSQITDPDNTGSKKYLSFAQQLYKLLIAPREEELQKQGINNLMFVMDEGLRSLPIAALHDGKQFLIEKYSLALIPSFSLVDTEYKGIKNAEVLAMGAATFTADQKQSELRAVPIEMAIVTQKFKGQSFLNQEFTLDNLKRQRTIKPYPIIHLATHADFPSKASGSKNQPYIQLYNKKLQLDQIEELGWKNPPVELLVLSACKSAVGDEGAELGFAGLAVKSGVKTAIASLWYVSDPGTFGLMTEFYNQLKNAPIKAEALRQAQIAMINNQVRLEGNEFVFSQGKIPVSPELAEYLRSYIKGNLSHPYYWAAFNVIGSPW